VGNNFIVLLMLSLLTVLSYNNALYNIKYTTVMQQFFYILLWVQKLPTYTKFR